MIFSFLKIRNRKPCSKTKLWHESKVASDSSKKPFENHKHQPLTAWTKRIHLSWLTEWCMMGYHRGPAPKYKGPLSCSIYKWGYIQLSHSSLHLTSSCQTKVTLSNTNVSGLIASCDSEGEGEHPGTVIRVSRQSQKSHWVYIFFSLFSKI